VPKDGEGQTEIKNTSDVAPREIDVPRWDHKKSDFVIAPLPPVESRGHPKAIPVDWYVPRALTSPSSGVVDLRYLDRVPRARLQTPPVYPANLRHDRVEGTVVVEFLVDEAGNVYHAVILSATTPGFEEAALRAVAKWKFEPGYRSVRRVHFRMSVPLVFRIADE
jgi:protein TonB